MGELLVVVLSMAAWIAGWLVFGWTVLRFLTWFD